MLQGKAPTRYWTPAYVYSMYVHVRTLLLHVSPSFQECDCRREGRMDFGLPVCIGNGIYNYYIRIIIINTDISTCVKY